MKRTNTKRFTHWVRRLVQGGLALSLVLIGMVAFSTVASAHNDLVVGVASCSSPLGSGSTVSWTISNDWDMSEAGTVTSVTGGLATLHPTNFIIAAQDAAYASHRTSRGAALPYLTATLTQKLPAGAPAVITLTTNSTWADGFNVSDAGTAELSGLHYGAPAPPSKVVAPPASQPIVQSIVQSIAGHIYRATAHRPPRPKCPAGRWHQPVPRRSVRRRTHSPPPTSLRVCTS
jgi:hypothetical protein